MCTRIFRVNNISSGIPNYFCISFRTVLVKISLPKSREYWSSLASEVLPIIDADVSVDRVVMPLMNTDCSSPLCSDLDNTQISFI